MQISNELRVGIMFLVGLILLVLMIISLTRWGQDRDTYDFTIRFTQAQGIQEGAVVRVAGVEVGRVSAIGLDAHDNTALVTVHIKRGISIYSGYSYIIGMGGIVGERYIEIRPTQPVRGVPVTEGVVVNGTPTPDLNDVIDSANILVAKLTTAADSLNTVIGDTESQQNLKSAIANLQKASTSAAEFSGAMNRLLARNEGAVDLVVANLTDVSGDIRRVSDSLSGQLERTNIISNLETASASVASITKRADNIAATLDTFLGDPEIANNLRAVVASLKQASTDLQVTLAQTRKASDSFPAIAQNLEQASDDLPKITQPFRQIAPETAQNILEISQRLRVASEGVGGVVQRVTRVGQALAETELHPEIRAIGVLGSDTGVRADVNLDLRRRNGMFRLGVADIGNSNRLNLQLGNRLGENTWLRYGLVQSRLGIGADYQPTPDLRLTGELFDPNHLRANALLDYRLHPLGDDWWLTTGWYDLFEGSHFGLGVTYRP